jgi:hypothetical protein
MTTRQCKAVLHWLTSNSQNNPTEITDLDIQTAVIALRQGNARLMTNPLPGENKFGKRCAEVKPTLIDMEALQGDMAQAQAA